MPIVQVSCDSGITKSTRWRRASRWVVNQFIDDAYEDWFSIPAHKSWTRKESVIAPDYTPFAVRSLRMKYMPGLADVEHVKPSWRKLDVASGIALLWRNNPFQGIPVSRERIISSNLR